LWRENPQKKRSFLWFKKKTFAFVVKTTGATIKDDQHYISKLKKKNDLLFILRKSKKYAFFLVVNTTGATIQDEQHCISKSQK